MKLSSESPNKEAPKQVSGEASQAPSSTYFNGYEIFSLEPEMGLDIKKIIAATNDVNSLMKRYADEFGFNKISKTYGVPLFSMDGDMEKVDGRWKSLIYMDELLVGPENIDRLGKTHIVWPDLASSVIEFGVMHERSESYFAEKTIDKQIEIGMAEYELKEMGLNEKDEKRLAFNFVHAHSARAQRDSQANLRVAASLLDSGVSPDAVKEKIAAFGWYLSTFLSYDLDRMPKDEREAKIREKTTDYLQEHFSWLKQKSEVVEKAIKVDREYQKRLQKELNIAYQ